MKIVFPFSRPHKATKRENGNEKEKQQIVNHITTTICKPLA
jgi:hypothetical protein